MGQMVLDLELDKKKGHRKIEYLKAGIEAKGHALIYKMHKYFARRPHNVFQNLIRHYSAIGDLVLDCFCGGGVTVYEALSLGRKVVGVDINPLATFITKCQTTEIPLGDYLDTMKEIQSKVAAFSRPMFVTQCRETGQRVAVRWNELAYVVACPHCRKNTSLANVNKAIENGKEKNGRYLCVNCGEKFEAIEAKLKSEELVRVIYRHPITGKRVSVAPVTEDIAMYERVKKNFDKIIAQEKLWYPKDAIPKEWDRQEEDSLHRKGIKYFSDFFTARNLLITAYYYKILKSYRARVERSLYEMLLFTFSATLRHTSNMTISAKNWMDGRPAAWTKHAFWLPYQFVEVNPIEYIEKRTTAVKSGLKFQKKTLERSNRVNTFSDLKASGTHIIWTRSSVNLDLPNECVDLIVTDPPYGSNVQYGELCSFWLVWLKNEFQLDKNLMDFCNEVLVHRKRKDKDYNFYNRTLFRIFKECYRVLKKGKPMVFTFNNKDVRAWYAVIDAAVRAGFELDKRGVIYQDTIENYKNTAHLRFAGALHGDIIYTFTKRKQQENGQKTTSSKNGHIDIEKLIVGTARRALSEGKTLTTSAIYVSVLLDLIPYMVRSAKDENTFTQMARRLEQQTLESVLQENFKLNREDGEWKLH